MWAAAARREAAVRPSSVALYSCRACARRWIGHVAAARAAEPRGLLSSTRWASSPLSAISDAILPPRFASHSVEELNEPDLYSEQSSPKTRAGRTRQEGDTTPQGGGTSGAHARNGAEEAAGGASEGEASSPEAVELQAAVGAPKAFELRGVEMEADDLLGVNELITTFRVQGHLLAATDPLGRVNPGHTRVPRLRQLLSGFPDAIDLEPFRLGHLDLDTPYHMGQRQYLPGGRAVWTMRELVTLLRATYTRTLSAEFMLLTRDERRWLLTRLERLHYTGGGDVASFGKLLEPTQRMAALRQLIQAEAFERFLGTSFPAAKRFGLEGCEALMVALSVIVERAAAGGANFMQVGMPHRGRLNVLAHLMHKPLGAIFSEFASRADNVEVGDVKYHLGTQSVVEVHHDARGTHAAARAVQLLDNRDVADLGEESYIGEEANGRKRVMLQLSANPSHLEAVDPVVMGRVRGWQHALTHGDGVGSRNEAPPSAAHTRPDAISEEAFRRVLGVLVHGDASFSGQGIVAETLQLAELSDYTVGGMVHVLLNNQIGFTTVPQRARSSPHPTDAAHNIGLPVLHVSADDPDAVLCAAQIAADFRQEFGRGAVLDLVGYRRHGHNEQDEPMFTQPLMYKTIAEHPNVVSLYVERLVADEVTTPEEVAALRAEVEQVLDEELAAAKHHEVRPEEWVASNWQATALESAAFGRTELEQPVRGDGGIAAERAPAPIAVASGGEVDTLANAREALLEDVPTGLPLELLRELGAKVTSLPQDGFVAHPSVRRLLKARGRAIEKGKRLDWASGEALAIASLMHAGHHVRLMGQDSERGTFSHRHAVVYDQESERRHVLFDGLGAPLHIGNSSLSEAAALGFEYGYSLARSDALCIWEAQFGDFANTAQHIIDTFIASGEQKWLQRSSLVMLLPHGFEGQGPDHSSARIERFLQLCNDESDALPGQSEVHRQAVEAGFAAVDRDGNGSLSRDEVVAAMQWVLRDASTLEDSDGEAVGAVQHTALEERTLQLFDSMDTDGDGSISASEWRTFMSTFLRHHAEQAHNLIVVNCSTPANLFHALRRQMVGRLRKPLVVAAPKYLLHHRPCNSDLVDMGPGTQFALVLGDERVPCDPADVRRVVLCSGSLYYSLKQARKAAKVTDVALVRLEQLSPFPYDAVAEATIARFPNAELVWAQEEPKNMGAWEYVRPRMRTMVEQLGPLLGSERYTGVPEARPIGCASRAAASAATGSFHVHRAESRQLVMDALGIPK